MEQSARKALLLASGTYDSDRIKNLSIVGNDIELMKSALEPSNYAIEIVGADPRSKLTRNNMVWTIRNFAKSASDGDTIIIYFTGHGIHFNGVDYVMPADAVFDDPENLSDYLVPLDFPSLLDQCRASTILIIVDACRNGLDLSLFPDVKAASLQSWSGGKIASSKKKHITYIYSCTAGEFSWYVDSSDGFSVFTKAVAEVLSPDYPASTLPELEAALQERVDRLSSQYGKPHQTVRVRTERNAATNEGGPIICLKPETAPPDSDSSAWRDAALSSVLWTIASPCDEGLKAALKSGVGAIAATAESLSLKAGAGAQNMPWTDSAFSLRFLSRVEFLCQEISQSFQPSCAEVALLIASIFTHEAVRAAALLSVGAEGIFEDPESARGEEGGDVRSAFLAALGKHDGLFAELPSQAASAEARDVRTAIGWVAQKWISSSNEFWHDGAGSFVQRHYWDQIFASDDSSPSSSILDRAALLDLARHLTEIEPFPLKQDYGKLLPVRTHFASTKLEQHVREIFVLHILVLAAQLAIDIAALPDLILENILIADAVSPSELATSLSNSEWLPVGRDRVLKARCTHPAIDLALRNHVDRANEVLQRIQQKSAQREHRLELAANLPTNLLATDIASSENAGPQSYLTPHIRLRLSDKKVRDLLMGERLYGDKVLAIREMYQNALDACRYRSARQEAAERQGQAPSQWRGSITFRQGVDADGRAYIECEDNGIGMSHAILSDCFACAGQRFADMAEFAEEQRSWRSLAPPIVMVPNSQFGIGVFSYFMLGAEVRIITRRYGRNGTLEDGLEAVVDSQSGLFRVMPHQLRESSGTVVRVYVLTQDDERISCLDTLSDLIFVADFDTFIDEGQRSVAWEAGKLTQHGRRSRRAIGRAGRRRQGWGLHRFYGPELEDESDSVIQSEDRHLWWCENQDGLLLADGIRTDRSLSYAIVNLTGPQRPLLSVDRLNLQRWDSDYVGRLLRDGVSGLVDAPWLCVRWMWRFAVSYPRLADKLVEQLSSLGRRLPLEAPLRQDETKNIATYDLSHVGCIPQDSSVLEALRTGHANSQGMPPRLLAHRCALWRRAAKPGADSEEAEPSLVGLPSISTADWLAVHRICLSEHLDGNAPWLSGRVHPGYVFCAAAATRRSPAAIGAALRGYEALLALDLSAVDLSALPDEPLDSIDVQLIGNRSKLRRFGDINILFASYRNAATISEIARRVVALEMFDVCDSDFSSELFEKDYVVEQRDIVILKAMQNWHSQPGPGDEEIIALADALDEPVAQVLDRLDHLSSLVPGLSPNVRCRIQEFRPQPGDVILLSRQLNGKAPWLSGNVAPGHILRAAVRLGASVEAVVAQLQPLAEVFELKLPALDWKAVEFDPLWDVDSWILSLRLDGSAPWLAGTVSGAHILAVAMLLDIPPGEAFDRLSSFSEVLGFRFKASREDVADLKPDEDDINILSVNMNGKHPWLTGSVTPRQVAERADFLEVGPDHIVERLEYYASLVELDMDQVRGFDFSGIESVATATNPLSVFSKHEAWSPRFTMRHAIYASHHLGVPLISVLAQAKCYRDIISYDIPDALEAKVPPDFPNDLDDAFLNQRPDDHSTTPRARWVATKPVTSAEILAVADDMRIAPQEILTRLKTVAAFGALPVADDVPAELPTILLSNDELAVLSRDGDGAEPWLTGTVPAMQIVFASYQTGLTMRTVLETLTRYREFLSIALPSGLDPAKLDEVADKLDCVLASINLDAAPPWIKGEISEIHLEAFARLTGLDKDASIGRLARLQAFGLVGRPPTGGLAPGGDRRSC